MEAATTLESQTVALSRAIEKLGSQAAMARLLGVTQPAVSKWLKHSRPLPAEYVLTVEAATGVLKEHLRPDIYPDESAPTPKTYDRVDLAAGPDFGTVEPLR